MKKTRNMQGGRDSKIEIDIIEMSWDDIVYMSWYFITTSPIAKNAKAKGSISGAMTAYVKLMTKISITRG
jgi:hypothetical protein